MKICVAQTKPVKGNIEKNIERHELLIDLAASNGAEMIVFPELSLTGYEPKLAKKLATNLNDPRFERLQTISDFQKITVGAGMPIKTDRGISISMLLFQPGKKVQLYSKQYLHDDEKDFFISASNSTGLFGSRSDIALAICYEISVPAHAKDAFKNGAKIYIASVAKFESGIEKATKRLSGIASDYSMTVLLSNCVGRCDGQTCAGKTSVWNNRGILTGQLNDTNEGILMINTNTEEVIRETL